MRPRHAILLALAALTAPANASAATEVGANGNIFLGGLEFDPAAVTTKVGETVSWRNNDFLVPHTATEDHRLWDLTGTYGQTPLNPPGFGPGTTVARRFEAGTHNYFCVVHPTQMRGTISVPVDAVSVRKRKRVRVRIKYRRRATGRRRTRRPRYRTRTKITTHINATWAQAAPGTGLVFDIERKRANGPWEPLLTGTPALAVSFGGGKPGTVWQVRARLRSKAEPARATGWSPPVQVRS